MRRKKHIQWFPTKPTLYQIYRSGLEYAFVSKDNKQVCPFVFCKDFLQDAIQGHLHKVKRKIFGFEYDPAKHHPLSDTETRLLLACSRDAYFRHKIPNCLDFINQIETKLKMRKAIATECANPPKQYALGGVWLLEGSRRWMISPPMISMYALLLRIGFVHKIGQHYEDTMIDVITKDSIPYQTKDRKQLLGALEGIQRIIKYGDRRIFYRRITDNYPAKMKVNIMHNLLGIVRFSRGDTATMFPYWNRAEVMS